MASQRSLISGLRHYACVSTLPFSTTQGIPFTAPRRSNPKDELDSSNSNFDRCSRSRQMRRNACSCWKLHPISPGARQPPGAEAGRPTSASGHHMRATAAPSSDIPAFKIASAVRISKSAATGSRLRETPEDHAGARKQGPAVGNSSLGSADSSSPMHIIR